MHALNAFFGHSKISISEFINYQTDFDTYNKKFNITTSCANYDMISSNQKNIVSHILKYHDVYTHYYAINEIYNKSIHMILDIIKGDFFFTYTQDHIKGIRRENNSWYYVDSLQGITSCDIFSLLHEKNIGFIIPVCIKKEFFRNVKIIKSIIDKPDINIITAYIIQKNKEKKNIGYIGNSFGDLHGYIRNESNFPQ